jgi:hypothetical protein
MIEVFKTNVTSATQANTLVDRIHHTFRNYRANFDLDDCDRILRVASSGFVQEALIIALLRDSGFHAEVLPDSVESMFAVNESGDILTTINQNN